MNKQQVPPKKQQKTPTQQVAMSKSTKNFELPIAQFIAIIVLSISIFLIIDFGRRAATGYRIRREEQRLEAQLEMAKQNHAALLERRDFVETDAYIAEIARNELKWSKPGETVIVILATPQAPSQTSLTAKQPMFTNNQLPTPSDAWFALFFPELVAR